jgi:hypothetical protein
MEVCGPTNSNPAESHNVKANSVGEREILIRVLAKKSCSLALFGRTHRDNVERHRFDHREKLKTLGCVISLEKPAMSFGNNQRCGDQRRWVREQPAEKRMVAIGSISKGD